jgi:hypothetical protein
MLLGSGPSPEASDRCPPEYADEAFEGPRWMPLFRGLFIAAGPAPRAAIASASVDIGRSCMSGSPEWVSETGAAPPIPLCGLPSPPLSDLASPITPAPTMSALVALPSVVEGLRVVVEAVVPQPRYPPFASLISVCSSPGSPATAPTAGKVGSWLGLNPYSSTSFLRSSSASFLCFLLRHRKIPSRTSNATTTIGITTAIAVLPPSDRPPEPAVCPDAPLMGPALVDVDDEEVVVDGDG